MGERATTKRRRAMVPRWYELERARRRGAALERLALRTLRGVLAGERRAVRWTDGTPRAACIGGGARTGRGEPRSEPRRAWNRRGAERRGTRRERARVRRLRTGVDAWHRVDGGGGAR